MPLFFFIAGMTLRPHASLTRYIRKKALRLLTPYISFMLIIATVALCISGSYGEGYKTLLLGGHYAQGIYGVFWFITVLLGALVLSQFIIARKLNIWAAIISFLLLSIPIQMMHILLPYSLQSVPMAAAYILAGYKFARDYQQMTIHSRPALYTTAAGIIAVIISLIYCDHIYIDMKNSVYGIPLLSTLLSLAIILLLITVSRHTLSGNIMFRASVILGQASLVIMYLHQFIHFYNIFHNIWLVYLTSVTIPLIVYFLIKRFSFLRKILLGEKIAC